MLAGAIAIAAAAPLYLVGQGMPAGQPLRPAAFMSDELLIAKATSATEWPFVVDEGDLRCVEYQGQRSVFFSEIVPPEAIEAEGSIKLPRTVVVTTNPLALFVTIVDKELYLPFDTLETLISRLAPFEAMGLKLCDGRGDSYDDDQF